MIPFCLRKSFGQSTFGETNIIVQYFLMKTLVQASSAHSGLGISMEQTLQNLQLSYVLPQLKYAMIVVAVTPILCVYPFVQKYFVQGVMLGSLKE